MPILDTDAEHDPNKILPMDYDWAREYYEAGVNNNWVPEEIPMQDDVSQWHGDALSDAERQLVEWNLGFFSTAESLTANNIVLAVYDYVTARVPSVPAPAGLRGGDSHGHVHLLL